LLPPRGAEVLPKDALKPPYRCKDLSDREQAISILRARGACSSVLFTPPAVDIRRNGQRSLDARMERLVNATRFGWCAFAVDATIAQSSRIEAVPVAPTRASAEDVGRWCAPPRAICRALKGVHAERRPRSSQLLSRYGVLTREAVMSESIPGGFGACYPVLKAMEDAGRLRRGYFIAGLGATQFALPGALDLLRSLKDGAEAPEVVAMAATDSANPYGAALKWTAAPGRGPTRTVGATVVLVDGALVGYPARGDRQRLTGPPDPEPQRSQAARAIANALIARARSGGETPRGMLIEEIDEAPPALHFLAPFLAAAGFLSGALGFQATREDVRM
jgi:hypothetical protein